MSPAAPSAAPASPQDLAARVKADALKGKLTDALLAEFKELAAVMEREAAASEARPDSAAEAAELSFRLGRIRTDQQFDIVHASPEPIIADPYPALAFPGWSVDWTKNGITRGAEVDIDGDV
jgi:hypothetical protein